jgi:GrpB-like predicted nucleotidyltransferase (UPF0157 family)
MSEGQESFEAQLARAHALGVVLRPYDPVWPGRFREAAAVIMEACGGLVVTIEHVGSTSVPGIVAKPYIDIMPGLRRHEDGDRIVRPMERLGYEYRGEFGISGRHFFTRWVDDDRHAWKHNVHCYEVGHVEWRRHLVFRDALRASPELREAYEVLKQELARVHPDNVEAYAEAKSDFVEWVITSAGGPARPGA